MSQRAGGLKLRAQEQISRLLTERGASFWQLTCPLRRFAPRRLVLRHGDCRAVLDRGDVFRVTYLERMQRVSGPFILGWDPADSSRYEIEHGWLAAAVRREDGERLASAPARWPRSGSPRAVAAAAWTSSPVSPIRDRRGDRLVVRREPAQRPRRAWTGRARPSMASS